MEDPLLGIGGGDQTGAGAEFGGGEGGTATEGREHGAVELDQVAGGEIGERVHVVGGQGRVEHEGIEANPAHKPVRAGPTIEGVVAVSTIEGVVAG